VPIIGAKPRRKYRGNIRHDIVQGELAALRLLAQNVHAKGAPFMTGPEQAIVSAYATLMGQYKLAVT